jgi:hypothetical protein
VLARSSFRDELREFYPQGRRGPLALLDYLGLPQSIRLDALRGVIAAAIMLAAAWLAGAAVMSLLQLWYEASISLEAAIAACMATAVADSISGLDQVMDQIQNSRSFAELDAAMARLEEYRQALEATDSPAAQQAYLACAVAKGDDWLRGQSWATPLVFIVPVAIATVLRFLSYRLMIKEGRDASDHARLGLFLRPFGGASTDDRIRFAERPQSFSDLIVSGSSRFGNIDQIFVEEASRFGAVYAIAKKGQKIPPSGARRIRCSDEEWRPHVAELVRAAWGCVICLASTDSMRWELGHLLAPSRVGEALVLSHPALRHNRAHDGVLEFALRGVGVEVAKRGWRKHVLGIVHWRGRPTILWSRRRDETVYQLAMRLFTRVHAGRAWKSTDVLQPSSRTEAR